MKKKNILLLIIITFLLTGCTFNYNTKIMLDGTVKESANNKVYVSEIFGEINEVDKKVLKKVVESYANSMGIKLEKGTVYNPDSAKAKAKKNYNSLDNFVNESKVIRVLFSKINIVRKKGTVLIESVDSEYEVNMNEYNGSTISISLPYKVVNTNADEIDKKTNTYTWKVDSSFDGINLEYKKNSLYTLNPIRLVAYATLGTYITLIASILVLVFVIFVIIYYYRAIKLYRK